MEEKSRSMLKREAEALQQLAINISKLPRNQILKLNLPEPILSAILEYKQMTSHGASRRQAQYIGRLMREADPEIIQRIQLPKKS